MFAFWVPVLLAFLVSLATIASVRPVAFRFALVDRPGGRKIHNADVPLVGGIGMFLGFFVALEFLPVDLRPAGEFGAVCAVFVLLGLLDDRYGLSPLLRLAIQLGAACWLALQTGLSAQFLGTLSVGNSAVILMTWPAVLLSGILVAGGVNAFNMIDGIDGLAGTMGLIAMVSIAFLSIDAGLGLPLGVASIGAGVVTAFLVFNLPLGFNRSVRCFMGDAGSMLIGFIVAWLLLRISQDASSGIEPVTVLFVVAVPISDLLWVFSIRMIRGQSPFRADNSHLHHYLLKAGLSHSGALSILSLVAILISIFGLSVSLLSLTGLQLIGIFLLCCGSLVFCVSNADRWVSVLPRAFKPLARGA